MDIFENPDVLVLFSGGKDSFLTACRLIQEGYRVSLLSCQNGALMGEQYLQYGAERLIHHFGEDRVSYAGILYTGATRMRLDEQWAQKPWAELGAHYPLLTNCQVQCLHCQTAMWICAIAWAKAHDICFLACGYKETDVFCTGMSEYMRALRALLPEGMSLTSRVWDVSSDYERDVEMESFGFIPAVLEPKCMLGRPPRELMSSAVKQQLMHYLEDNLLVNAPDLIEHLIPAYRAMKLSPTTFHFYDRKEALLNE